MKIAFASICSCVNNRRIWRRNASISWQIASLVTQKPLSTVTHALFFISFHGMPYSLTEASQPIDSVIYWHNRCVDAKPDIHKCNHRRIRIGYITRRIYSILNTHSFVTRCLILVRKWNSTLLGNMTPPRNGHVRMIKSTFANLTFYDTSYYA